MFFMKLIVTEKKIYERMNIILSALDVTASHARRKMVKRNL